MQVNQELSRKQEIALLSLISGVSVSLTSKNLKISESTLWRWLQQPAFNARYRMLRRSIVENAVARLQSLASKAVETLERNLSSGHAPSECRAALGILSKSLDAIDLLELETRLSSIERKFELKAA